MTLSRVPRLFFVILFIVFLSHTLLAYYFHWDAYLYKRLQDTLVIAIGTTVWVVSAKKLLSEIYYIPYLIALALSTIIVATHILRMINGGLLC